MITWIQNSFQKHHKWLFGILIAVIVVAFVLTIGEQSFFGGPPPPEQRQLDFFGYNLASERESQRLFLAAQISASINREQQMIFGNNLEDYALARAAALHLADQTGIPDPTRDQFRDFLQTKAMFQGQDGGFSQTRFNDFTDRMQANPRITEDLIISTLAEDWRIDRISKATGGPGYTHPYEARMQYLEENSIWDIEVASWDFDAFDPEIDPDDSTLIDYYNDNPQRYEVPQQVRVSVVQFYAEDFLDGVSAPGDQAVAEYFERNKARFEDQTEAESEEITLDAVRADVVDAIRYDRARRLAAEAAESFTVKLFRERNRISRGSAEFDEAVAAFRGRVRELDPYSRDNLPTQTGIPRRILNAAFNLDDRDYYSQVAETGDGGAVLVYHETIPARIPEFEEVADAVREDYANEERRRRFIETGEEVRQYLEESVAFGATFRETAEEEGFRVQSFGPFEGSQPPEGFNPRHLQHAVHLDPGEVAGMIFQGNQGIFVFLQDRDAPDVDTDSPEIADMIARMNETMGSADAWMLFAQMAHDEYRRADTGGFQPLRR